MTDLERAAAYHAADEWPDPWPVQRKQAIDRLAAEFAAVRADERARVLAELRASIRVKRAQPASLAWEDQLTWS